MRPLLYLEIRVLINAIKSTVKTPKRLIPALIFGAWFVSIVVNGLVMASGEGIHRDPDLSLIAGIPTEVVESLIFLFVSLGCVSTLFSSFNTGLLIFSIAHIDFLFPTPISRKSVVLVRLLKDYMKYAAYVVLFYLFVGSSIFQALGVRFMPWALVGIVGLSALLITVVNLSHTLNLVFTFGYERLKTMGLAIKAVLIAVPVSAIAYGAYRFSGTDGGFSSVISAANSPVISLVFAPAKWSARLLLAPLLGVTADGWLQFAMLLVMAFASFCLLMSRRENIYEPSLGVSIKTAQRREAIRVGDYLGLRRMAMQEKGTKRIKGLSVPAFGRGAAAIYWKNLLTRYRSASSGQAFMMVAPIFITYIIKRTVHDSRVIEYLPLIFLYVVWIVSMMSQLEFRNELKQANILKSAPLTPWKIIVAQLGASITYAVLGLLVFAFWIAVMLPDARTQILLISTIAGPFVGFVSLSASMITALLYPDQRDAAQNYLCGIVTVLVQLIAFLPVIISVMMGYFLLHRSIIAALVFGCVSCLISGLICVMISGLQFRKFDPTSE